jgi:hypothetical protein
MRVLAQSWQQNGSGPAVLVVTHELGCVAGHVRGVFVVVG